MTHLHHMSKMKANVSFISTHIFLMQKSLRSVQSATILVPEEISVVCKGLRTLQIVLWTMCRRIASKISRIASDLSVRFGDLSSKGRGKGKTWFKTNDYQTLLFRYAASLLKFWHHA